MTLDFILRLILYRFLIKFLLPLRRKLMRVCCQLPSCSVLRGYVPLRDRRSAVGALALWSCSLQQRVLLTMRTGLSFARYISFTRSAEMSVSPFTGCAYTHNVSFFFYRGLRIWTTIASQISSLASLCHSHCGQLRLRASLSDAHPLYAGIPRL